MSISFSTAQCLEENTEDVLDRNDLICQSGKPIITCSVMEKGLMDDEAHLPSEG